MDYAALAMKFGAREEKPKDLAALAMKFGAKVSQQPSIGEAAANPEANVLGMKIQGETDSGFNPAAALIAAGGKAEDIRGGIEQAKLLAQYGIERLLPFGSGGQTTLDRLEGIRQAQQAHEKAMADLKTVNPGSTMLGETALYAAMPVKTLPIVGAAEYGTPQERAARAAMAYAGNKATQVAANAAAGKIKALGQERVTNAPRDAAVTAAKDAGYAVLPSESGGSLTGRLMEGASGQIKAKQAFQVKNQPVTDAIARAEAGVSPEVQLTYDALKQARAQAYSDGYKPLVELWGDKVKLKPSDAFKADVSSLTSRADEASKVFGDAVKSDVGGLVEQVKNAKPMTVSQAMDGISIFREKASDAYRLGERDMGRAYRKVAESLEKEVGRHLAAAKKYDLLNQFQKARQTIAKNFDVEAALSEGRGVNAEKLAKMYAKNPDKFSGGLKTVAQSATALKDSMKLPVQGGELPISALDTWGASTGQIGGLVASMLTGSPIPALIPAATVAARVGARKGLLTGPGQRMFTNPNYDPSLLLRGERALLDNRVAPWAGGLLGLAYAN